MTTMFHALAPLRHRNFRLLWTGQVCSSIGQQMQIIAIGWHLYELTDSAVALGLASLFRLVPFMALSLLGGALADSMDRRRLLLVTQVLQMGVALWLATTSSIGVDGAWVIYAATFVGGALMAFDGPARQAMVPGLVPPEDLTGALTLNTLARQAATVVGPGLGGVCVAAFGLGPTYALNSASFIAVVGSLLVMQNVHIPPVPSGSNAQRIAEGLRFARSEPLVLLPLLLDFLTRALGSPRALLPVFARDIFAVGPAGLGWLASAAAVGAVLGGLALGSLRSAPRPILLMLGVYVLEGLCNAAFAVSPGFLVAWFTLFLGGVCNVLGEVLHATIIQLRTPDHLRGRTTAFGNMLGAGGPQLGQLEAGLLAGGTGPVAALLFNGLAAAGISAGFAFLPGLRKQRGTRKVTDLAVAAPA